AVVGRGVVGVGRVRGDRQTGRARDLLGARGHRHRTAEPLDGGLGQDALDDLRPVLDRDPVVHVGGRTTGLAEDGKTVLGEADQLPRHQPIERRAGHDRGSLRTARWMWHGPLGLSRVALSGSPCGSVTRTSYVY